MPLPISFQDLSVRVHHPTDTTGSFPKENESPDTSLTAVPWTLTTKTEQSNIITTPSNQCKYGFPNLHYLELRREQNKAFADECLQQGNQELILLNTSKAQEFYQQGLDLVPDHIPILLAQVRLWMQLSATMHSANTVSLATIRTHITHILELDPQNQDAHNFSKQLQSNNYSTARGGTLLSTTTKHGQPRKYPGLILKHEPLSAYQDALTEWNILPADDVSLVPAMEGSPGVGDKDVASSRCSKDKKKRKHRRRYDTSSSDDSSSGYSSDSSDDRRERRRRYRRKRRHKRKHHRREYEENDGGSREENDQGTNSNDHPQQNNASTADNQKEREDDSETSNKKSRKHRHRRRSSHKKRKREKRRRRRDDSSSASND